MKEISTEPKDRLSNQMKNIIQLNPFFDIHCHIFNKEFVPDKFLGFKVNFTEKILQDISNFLKNLVPSSDKDKFSNLGYFVEIFNNKSMEELLIKLLEYYSYEKNVILCPLMMDMTKSIKGKVIKSYNEQINEMESLMKKYPDKILPFISLDPNNPEMKEIFYKAFSEQNFFGIKIYPSLGYLPSHPKLMEIFEICEKKNIPITTHCGGGDVHSSNMLVKNIIGIEYNHNKNGDFFEIKKAKSKLFFSKDHFKTYFNHPINWVPVLKCYPKLRLNFGHFGSVEEWQKFKKGENNTWVSRIIDLMYNYENVYADISFNIYDIDFASFIRKKIEDNKILQEKTLYGSDWYMIVIKGHFRSIKVDFFTTIGDKIKEYIAYKNPLKFLGLK